MKQSISSHSIYFVLFCQASEKKEHKFKFATHIPSKMEQVISSIQQRLPVLLRIKLSVILSEVIICFSNRAVSFFSVVALISIIVNKACVMISFSVSGSKLVPGTYLGDKQEEERQAKNRRGL